MAHVETLQCAAHPPTQMTICAIHVYMFVYLSTCLPVCLPSCLPVGHAVSITPPMPGPGSTEFAACSVRACVLARRSNALERGAPPQSGRSPAVCVHGGCRRKGAATATSEARAGGSRGRPKRTTTVVAVGSVAQSDAASTVSRPSFVFVFVFVPMLTGTRSVGPTWSCVRACVRALAVMVQPLPSSAHAPCMYRGMRELVSFFSTSDPGFGVCDATPGTVSEFVYSIGFSWGKRKTGWKC